jgi:hypothetical protein
MSTESISINVDADAARTFCAATPVERRKIELLLSLRLRELTSKDARSLREIMDEIGNQAESRGLTPDVVESLLRDE